jgi:MFS family permease
MLDKIIVNQYNLWVVIFVALGTISTAYGLAIIGSTVGQPNFYTYFHLATAGEPGYDHTTNMIGALNGVNSAGAIGGCIFQGWSSDYYGRKRTMQIGCCVLIVGGALCSGAVDMAMFLVGRFIAGLGAGVLACVVPIYQAEVSTADTRGAMVCVTGIMYAFGYSLAGWMGYACYFMKASDPAAQFSWRFPLAFQVFFPVVVLAGSKLIPFSPRWLLSQGRRQEALDIVMKLHKTPSDPEHIKAREEFWLMEQQYELDASLNFGKFELFRTAANRKRALMAFMLMWGDQFLGIFVMTNYVSLCRLIRSRSFANDVTGSFDLRQPGTQWLDPPPPERLLDHPDHRRQHVDGPFHRPFRPTQVHAHRCGGLHLRPRLPQRVDGLVPGYDEPGRPECRRLCKSFWRPRSARCFRLS